MSDGSTRTGARVLLSWSEDDFPLDSNHTMTVERTNPLRRHRQRVSCFEVGLFTDDTNSGDMLAGQASPLMADVTVDAARAADEFVVAARRSTPVIVTVDAWRERPVVVRVAAEGPGRSRLRLTARDARFDVARSTTSWPVRVRQVEAQRPRPGRYESADGTVSFRVSRGFVVRGLQFDDVLHPCHTKLHRIRSVRRNAHRRQVSPTGHRA